MDQHEPSYLLTDVRPIKFLSMGIIRRRAAASSKEKQSEKHECGLEVDISSESNAASMQQKNKTNENQRQPLESKKYFFLADGTMPVLDFEITQGKAPKNSEEAPAPQSEHLTLELYNPLSGEVFEAKFSKGRIEVDLDGTITYFSQSAERVSFSLFLGRSIIVTMDKKSGEVLIKSPSKIVSIEREGTTEKKGGERRRRVEKAGRPSEVVSDTLKLKLA
jgi:hypothetical protein